MMLKSSKRAGRLLAALLGAAIAAGPVLRAKAGGTEAYLNALDLNLAQYNERMGLSLWIFNQNAAQAGLGSSEAVRARGRARIKAGKASVQYRPVAATLASEFAGARRRDAAKRREIARTYDLFLSRFRDAQRKDRLGERDVASTLGLAFSSYYEIYSTGQQASGSQDRDIVAQFRRALLADAYFQGTNDRYRQLLDENTAVQTVAALVGYRSAVKKGDKQELEASRREALAFLDFYWPGDEEKAKKIRLTPAGFRD